MIKINGWTSSALSRHTWRGDSCCLKRCCISLSLWERTWCDQRERLIYHEHTCRSKHRKAPSRDHSRSSPTLTERVQKEQWAEATPLAASQNKTSGASWSSNMLLTVLLHQTGGVPVIVSTPCRITRILLTVFCPAGGALTWTTDLKSVSDLFGFNSSSFPVFTFSLKAFETWTLKSFKVLYVKCNIANDV